MTNHARNLYILAAAIGLFTATRGSAQPDWSVTPSDYQYTMTITCVAVSGCTESSDTNDIVAAFIGGELRGVQQLKTDFQGRKYAFMIVYDHDFTGNTIAFKYYNAAADSIFDATDTVGFTENANVGDVDDPFRVRHGYGIQGTYLTQDTLPENAGAGDTVASIFALNEHQDTVAMSWEFVQDAQGPDNFRFTISGNALNLNEDVHDAPPMLQIHLKGTAGNGCVVDTVFVLTSGTPVSSDQSVPLDALSGQVRLFPNPVAGTLHLATSGRIGQLRVYGSQGNLIYAASELSEVHDIDVSLWAPQVYWVVVELDGVLRSQKVVVQR